MIVSLTEIKNHLGISGTTDDTALGYYLNAISEWVKEYLGRVIEKQTDISEYFDGDNIKDTIFLSNYPVISFRWLKYKTGTNSQPEFVDFNIDDYQRDDESGIIYCDVMYSGIRNINVVYTAGYEAADIPNAIKVACMKLVAKIYNKRRSDGYSSEEIANARVEWDKFLTQDVELLLAPYKKKRI